MGQVACPRQIETRAERLSCPAQVLDHAPAAPSPNFGGRSARHAVGRIVILPQAPTFEGSRLYERPLGAAATEQREYCQVVRPYLTTEPIAGACIGGG